MASNKGAPTQSTVDAFSAQSKAARSTPLSFTDYRLPTAHDAIKAGADTATASSNNELFQLLNSTRYPTRTIATDDRATMFDMKHQLDQANMISASRPLPYTDAEIQYIIDRQAAEEFAAFDQWLGSRYDLNDPATKAWFKSIVPSYFTRRKEVLNEAMKLHAKYSNMRFEGPLDQEDLVFQYNVETGKTVIPTGPFYDPYTWTQNQIGYHKKNNKEFMEAVAQNNETAYKYGLFNPYRPRTPFNDNAAGRNPANPGDLVGNPANRMYGPLGMYPPTEAKWAVSYGGDNMYNLRANEAAFQAEQLTYRPNSIDNSTKLNPPARYNIN